MSQEKVEVGPIRRGYRDATPIERAAFGMLSSFGVSIGVARAIAYVMERRRPAPGLRDRVRRLSHSPGEERVRIHHFLPGVALAVVPGGAAIVAVDEIALLIDRD